MSMPFQVTIRDVPRTARLDEAIDRYRAKLEKLRPDLTGGTLVIERPHEWGSVGIPVRVRIHLRVPPGHEIVATEDTRNQDPSKPLVSIVGAAFASAERQLKKLTARQRGQTKSRAAPEAIVSALRDAGDATWSVSVESEIVESVPIS